MLFKSKLCIAIFVMFFISCGSDESSSDDTDTQTTVESDGNTGGTNEMLDLAQGEELYDDNCSSCHGYISQSDVSGASVSEIQSALTSVDQMIGINISDDELSLISNALGQ